VPVNQLNVLIGVGYVINKMFTVLFLGTCRDGLVPHQTAVDCCNVKLLNLLDIKFTKDSFFDIYVSIIELAVYFDDLIVPITVR